MKKLIALCLALVWFTQAQAATVYASYSNSQRGVTIRNEMLVQSAFLPMPFTPTAIADGADNSFYLISGNNIYRYDTRGRQLAHFAWPETSIKYTGVAKVGDSIFVTYTGSQTGVSVRDARTLQQTAVFPTPFAPKAITVSADRAMYLASGNHLYKYDAAGNQLIDMNFPDRGVNYTGITLKGNAVYASYNGSQTGFTIRDSQLRQSNYIPVSFSPTGISAGSDNDLYLSSRNHLYRYKVSGQQLKEMTFPRIDYTGVAFDAQ